MVGERLRSGVILTGAADAIADAVQAVVELIELGDDARHGILLTGSTEELALAELFFDFLPTSRLVLSRVPSSSLNLSRLASAPLVRVWDSLR